MIHLSREQNIQEERYQFPYHYIPVLNGNKFSEARILNWGYLYLSSIYFLLDIIKKMDFNSLLDVGCGDGRFLYEVQKHFPNRELVGIDNSETAIGFARLMCPNVRYVCGNISDSSMFGNDFNLITLIETLEHIPPPAINNFLKGISDALSEEGNFILTVPSDNIKRNLKHYQHFNLQSLKNYIETHFKIINHFFINRISLIDKIVRGLLANNLFILNEKRTAKLLYTWYRNNCLKADEKNGKIIVLIGKKRKG
jgi:SAM-dependent methyltransferase